MDGNGRIKRALRNKGLLVRCLVVMGASLACSQPLLWGAGCGPGGATSQASSDAHATSVVGGTLVEPVNSQGSVSVGADVREAFTEVASALAPVHIYVPSELPTSATLADHWWPVLETCDPTAYSGPSRPNPYILTESTEASAQVLVDTSGGWLLFLDNFRGDLGDATGETVGAVVGNVALRYEVEGGVLVQWSDSGRWYGVFGRGLPEGLVTNVALRMVLSQPTTTR